MARGDIGNVLETQQATTAVFGEVTYERVGQIVGELQLLIEEKPGLRLEDLGEDLRTAIESSLTNIGRSDIQNIGEIITVLDGFDSEIEIGALRPMEPKMASKMLDKETLEALVRAYEENEDTKAAREFKRLTGQDIGKVIARKKEIQNQLAKTGNVTKIAEAAAEELAVEEVVAEGNLQTDLAVDPQKAEQIAKKLTDVVVQETAKPRPNLEAVKTEIIKTIQDAGIEPKTAIVIVTVEKQQERLAGKVAEIIVGKKAGELGDKLVAKLQQAGLDKAETILVASGITEATEKVIIKMWTDGEILPETAQKELVDRIVEIAPSSQEIKEKLRLGAREIVQEAVVNVDSLREEIMIVRAEKIKKEAREIFREMRPNLTQDQVDDVKKYLEICSQYIVETPTQIIGFDEAVTTTRAEGVKVREPDKEAVKQLINMTNASPEMLQRLVQAKGVLQKMGVNLPPIADKTKFGAVDKFVKIVGDNPELRKTIVLAQRFNRFGGGILERITARKMVEEGVPKMVGAWAERFGIKTIGGKSVTVLTRQTFKMIEKLGLQKGLEFTAKAMISKAAISGPIGSFLAGALTKVGVLIGGGAATGPVGLAAAAITFVAGIAVDAIAGILDKGVEKLGQITKALGLNFTEGIRDGWSKVATKIPLIGNLLKPVGNLILTAIEFIPVIFAAGFGAAMAATVAMLGPILIIVILFITIFPLLTAGPAGSALVSSTGLGAGRTGTSEYDPNASGKLGEYIPGECTVSEKAVLTRQTDPAWADYLLPGSGRCTIRQAGCGPTSVSMILQAKNSTLIPPVVIDKYYPNAGCAGTSIQENYNALVTVLGAGAVTYNSMTAGCDEEFIGQSICAGKIVMILANFLTGNGVTGHYVLGVTVQGGDIITKDPFYNVTTPFKRLNQAGYIANLKGCILIDANSI